MAHDLVAAAVLRQGVRGDDVRALQARLTALGHDTRGTDGNFGPRTREAVIAFPKAHQLRRDGVAGPMTLEALDL